jgi:hypothetical protein
MGSWNETCACTHLPIIHRETCAIIICKDDSGLMPDNPTNLLDDIMCFDIGPYDEYGSTKATAKKYPGNIYTDGNYLKVFLGSAILKHFQASNNQVFKEAIDRYYKVAEFMGKKPTITKEQAYIVWCAWYFCMTTRTNLFGTCGTGSQQGITDNYKVLADILIDAHKPELGSEPKA